MIDLCKDLFSKEENPHHSFPELSYAAWMRTKNQPKSGDEKKPEEIRYWLYAPGERAYKWDEFYEQGIMGIGWDGIGDLSQFETKNLISEKIREVYNKENSPDVAALMNWQFKNEIRPGDIVYVKKGTSKIIGSGIVQSDYIFESERSDFKHIRKTKWTHKGEWTSSRHLPQHTLTEITSKSDINLLQALLDQSDQYPIPYDDWWPLADEYHPGITVEKWQELLNDKNVFNNNTLIVMKRFLDNGGSGTCKELSLKYGEHSQFYSGVSLGLAKSVHKATNCKLCEKNNRDSRWWPILYLGKYVSNDNVGMYSWKLRPELQSALKSVDLSIIQPEAKPKPIDNYSEDDFLAEVFMDKD